MGGGSAVGILFLITTVAMGATLHVPGEYEKIQEGIDAALIGDTVLVAPGTYLENLTFLGREIVLLSEEGPATTVIDGSDPP
jgi:hypothetical protein